MESTQNEKKRLLARIKEVEGMFQGESIQMAHLVEMSGQLVRLKADLEHEQEEKERVAEERDRMKVENGAVIFFV